MYIGRDIPVSRAAREGRHAVQRSYEKMLVRDIVHALPIVNTVAVTFNNNKHI